MTGLDERDRRQELVNEWVRRTFGTHVDVRERARRFFEEAVELVQAVGLDRNELAKIALHVYEKPAGGAFQEAGGAGMTLLALCEALAISADEAELTEFARVLGLPREHFPRAPRGEGRRRRRRSCGGQRAMTTVAMTTTKMVGNVLVVVRREPSIFAPTIGEQIDLTVGTSMHFQAGFVSKVFAADLCVWLEARGVEIAERGAP